MLLSFILIEGFLMRGSLIRGGIVEKTEGDTSYLDNSLFPFLLLFS